MRRISFGLKSVVVLLACLPQMMSQETASAPKHRGGCQYLNLMLQLTEVSEPD